MIDFSTVDWTAVSSAFSAVVLAGYGLGKAVAKLIALFAKKYDK